MQLCFHICIRFTHDVAHIDKALFSLVLLKYCFVFIYFFFCLFLYLFVEKVFQSTALSSVTEEAMDCGGAGPSSHHEPPIRSYKPSTHITTRRPRSPVTTTVNRHDGVRPRLTDKTSGIMHDIRFTNFRFSF